MKNILLYTTILFTTSTLHAQEIQHFMQLEPPKSKRFQCAYQTRVAPKPCIVSLHMSKPEHFLTKQHFGENVHPMLKIQWPDGQSSRYALMSPYELLNIQNEKHYRFKTASTSSTELDFSNGLIILDQQHEHIRLW